jgi:hypothetical protein
MQQLVAWWKFTRVLKEYAATIFRAEEKAGQSPRRHQAECLVFAYCLADTSTLKIQAKRFFETSVNICYTTQRHIPEDPVSTLKISFFTLC